MRSETKVDEKRFEGNHRFRRDGKRADSGRKGMDRVRKGGRKICTEHTLEEDPTHSYLPYGTR